MSRVGKIVGHPRKLRERAMLIKSVASSQKEKKRVLSISRRANGLLVKADCVLTRCSSSRSRCIQCKTTKSKKKKKTSHFFRATLET